MSPRIAPRPLPPYFLHPRYHEQMGATEMSGLSVQILEEYPSRCKGHVSTKVFFHSMDGDRRYLVEVILGSGTYVIEAPCTYAPVLGMDLVDGNLVLDAEEWILVQHLKLKPQRLSRMFGSDDRQEAEEYIRRATAPHAGARFQDVEPEFEKPEHRVSADAPSSTKEAKKRWWKFW